MSRKVCMSQGAWPSVLNRFFLHIKAGRLKTWERTIDTTLLFSHILATYEQPRAKVMLRANLAQLIKYLHGQLTCGADH